MKGSIGPLAMLGALLLVLPTAYAATSISTTATEDDPIIIPHAGSASIPFNVTITCDQILTGIPGSMGPALTITVTGSGPEWLNATDTEVEFELSDCSDADPTSEFPITKPGNLPVTVTADNAGMAKQTVTMTAGDDTVDATIMVEYNAYFDFIVDAEFPMDTGGDPVTFNVTYDVSQVNAPSMVMIDDSPAKPQLGSLSGLGFHNFDPVGEGILVNEVTYKPSAKGEDTVTFITWAHCLCDSELMTEPQEITWTFVNDGGGGGGDGGDGGDDNGIPGFEVVLMAGVLAAAAVALRRRL